jgi:hypothetical protein
VTTTTATDGDKRTRVTIERHPGPRIGPAKYWLCDPRPAPIDVKRICHLYLHRAGDFCESVRRAPAHREHLFSSSSVFFLPSLFLPANQRHAVTASAGLNPPLLLVPSCYHWACFDSRPRLLAADISLLWWRYWIDLLWYPALRPAWASLRASVSRSFFYYQA